MFGANMYLLLCIYLCKIHSIVLVNYGDSYMNAGAKELEFPVHFYSTSFRTTLHQKYNSVEELQQCSLIEVSQNVSMEAHTGNVFVSIDSEELKYLLACTFEVMLLSKWFLEAKK